MAEHTARWGAVFHLTRWNSTFRRMAAPTISAFLCFLFVVITPLSNLGGRYAFLTYTSFILFFMPRGTISGQLETTVLGMLGVLIGLGWSCAVLAVACGAASIHGADSSQSRAVLGIGLGILALACGFVRSYYLRFSTGSRIGMFYSIFLITSNQDVTHMSSRFFTDQLAVAGFSAVFALVPALIIFPHTSEQRLTELITKALRSTSDLFPRSLASVIESSHGGTPSTPSRDAAKAAEEQPDLPIMIDELVSNLKEDMNSMRHLFKTYRLEIVHARLRPSSLHTLVETIARLQRNPLLGSTRHIPGERIRIALEKSIAKGTAPGTGSRTPTVRYDDTPNSQRSVPLSAIDLRHKLLEVSVGDGVKAGRSPSKDSKDSLYANSQRLCIAIKSAFTVASSEFGKLYDIDPIATKPSMIAEAKDDLETALHSFDRGLGGLLGLTEGPYTTKTHKRWMSESNDDTPRADIRDPSRFRSAFYMTALRDLAKDVLNILEVVDKLKASATIEKRWYFPTAFNLWHRSVHTTEPDNEGDEDLSKAFHDPNFVEETLRQSHVHQINGTRLRERIERAWRRVWDRRGVLKARIAASSFIHHLRHSRHVLFAIKFASGISLLSLPAFLPPNSSGRNWYDSTRGAWTVISYMYVLEVTTGATFRVGVYRIIGTFLGALAAYICALIVRENPFGLVALATACSVPIHYGMLFSKRAPIALVAGITLPPILFLPYLGLNDGQAYFTIAWTRFTDITIGIVAAVLVNVIVWPLHARVRYFSLTCEILDQISELYLRMSRDNLRSSLIYSLNTHQYNTLEDRTLEKISQSRSLVLIQRKEVSLLPRPIKLYSEIIDSTEKLVHVLSDIRSLRFGVPRQTTVLEVLPLRQEVVSSVLITLFALSHSFRSRTSLPQFIPSPKRALGELMDAVEDHARLIRYRRVERSGEGSAEIERMEIEIVYAMAEGEALNELCQILDQLVAAARTLFGTKSFLDASRAFG